MSGEEGGIFNGPSSTYQPDRRVCPRNLPWRGGGAYRTVLPIIIAAMLASIAQPISEPAYAFIRGINLANAQNLNARDRARLLAALRDEGVTAIRIPLTPAGGSLGPALDLIRRAARVGIATVLVIWPAYRGGAVRKHQAGTVAQWDQPRLSFANAEDLVRALAPLLDELDAEGVTLAGLEYGNEFNWTPFNGDFPVQPGNMLYSLADLETSPQAAALARGLDTIVPCLSALRRLRARLHANARTPIILGGLADTGALTPTAPPHPDAASPAAVIAYLRERGLDRAVDYYGVHAYFAPGEGGSDLRAHLERIFEVCGRVSQPGSRPCWLTEWGIAGARTSCPGHAGPRRLVTATAVVGWLRQYLAAGRLFGSLYFDWSGDGYALWSCNTLSPTGRIVLSSAGGSPDR